MHIGSEIDNALHQQLNQSRFQARSMARILIIDDDKPFREALAESVRDFGHDVMVGSGAQEAFELINDAEVALLEPASSTAMVVVPT
jgi:PleD family two-component response regulator